MASARRRAATPSAGGRPPRTGIAPAPARHPAVSRFAGWWHARVSVSVGQRVRRGRHAGTRGSHGPIPQTARGEPSRRTPSRPATAAAAAAASGTTRHPHALRRAGAHAQGRLPVAHGELAGGG